jgi:hypothetical protein
MNDDMRRLTHAVELAQQRTDPLRTDMRVAIVTAVLRELQAIVNDRSTHDLHEAQIARYTDIACRTALQGG